MGALGECFVRLGLELIQSNAQLPLLFSISIALVMYVVWSRAEQVLDSLLIRFFMFQVMVLDYKLTYPSGTATAMLINSFHTNSGAELAA